MHDLSHFRSHFDGIAARLATRTNPPNLDQFRELDRERRAAITEAEQLKARRNAESQEIARLKREGADTSERQQQVRGIGDRVGALDEQVKALDERFRELLEGIPNIPHESVPLGKGEEDNVEVRRVGTPPVFDFEPKPHWDLG